MRKIEENMIVAVKRNKNWSSGNTTVRTDDNNESRVFLHGNHIATVTEDDVILFDGGWQTNTTKSRLNAICGFYCEMGEGVFQKNYKWYVRRIVGAINGKLVYKNDEFHSGYTL